MKKIALIAVACLVLTGCSNDGAPPKLVEVDSNGCQIWYYNPVRKKDFHYVVCPFRLAPTATIGSHKVGKTRVEVRVSVSGI